MNFVTRVRKFFSQEKKEAAPPFTSTSIYSNHGRYPPAILDQGAPSTTKTSGLPENYNPGQKVLFVPPKGK